MRQLWGVLDTLSVPSDRHGELQRRLRSGRRSRGDRAGHGRSAAGGGALGEYVRGVAGGVPGDAVERL
jgi:hypothetical protein